MKETINQLKEIIEDVLVRNYDTKIDWAHKPSPQKWSPKEIVGHLIDSAQINLQRFVRCTYQENFKLTYEQDEWVKAGRYQQADIRDLTGLWVQLNLQIARVLENYPADRLKAKCDNSKQP